MHIPDGFVSVPVAACGYGASALAVGWAVRRVERDLDERLVPVVGMMTAFIFAAQMLNFPVAAGTSGHFMGAALATIVLGPAGGLLAMTLVVALQCLMFADGGVTALGVNVLNMGVVGCLVTSVVLVVFRPALSRGRKPFVAASAVAAFASIVVASAACAVELALSGTASLMVALPAMVVTHVVIGVGEAAITSAALSMLLQSRPDLLATWLANAPPDGVIVPSHAQ